MQENFVRYGAMNLKRFLVGTILLLLPFVAVQSVKRTTWGPILNAPKARQWGDPKSKVTIVEYSDFQCPSCAKVDPIVHQLMDVYKGKVRWIYKYFPLTKVHKNAMTSAHAAECAAAQDKFWPYHDKLFQTQPEWAELQNPTTSFVAIAQDTHLDLAKFNSCYADPSRLAPIEQDAKEAEAREVAATPTFFIGDERLVGQVFASDGARTIEKELRQ